VAAIWKICIHAISVTLPNDVEPRWFRLDAASPNKALADNQRSEPLIAKSQAPLGHSGYLLAHHEA
jgi:hypothetical protein